MNPTWHCAHNTSITYPTVEGPVVEVCRGYNMSGGKGGMRQQCSSWRIVEPKPADDVVGRKSA